MKKDNIINGILIVLLLALAAALRLYHPYAIPFTYDELGSMFRANFTSFSQMVNHNMMVDFHPVGVEAFLFYWTKLVGDTPLYVKLPFIVSGIFSILYVFKLGKDWFNPTVGLVCAAYIATLQFTIMNSQEIRLYGIGLFFTLGMAWHWSKIIFTPEKRFDLNWLLYVLFSALCAYTHYFALLSAIITGVTGIFLIKRRYVVRYITAGIMIFVLFIPHLHILFYQLTVDKGLGEWVTKPTPAFLVEYLKYIFHFSPYVYGTAAAMLLFGIVYSIVRKTFRWKPMLLSFLWFALPLGIAYAYSVFVNPVLIYRVLAFSFPFMLFTFFGMLPDINAFIKIPLVAVICATNIMTLIVDRKYYDFYYVEPIKKICFLNDSVAKTLGKEGTVRFLEGDTSKTDRENYYVRKYKLDSTYLPLDNTPNKATLIDYLEDRKVTVLSYGCLNEADVDYLPIFLNYYPHIKKQYNFWGGNFYVLTNQASNGYEFDSKQDFEGTNPKGWGSADGKYITDTVHFAGSHCYRMDSLHEYGPTFTYNLKDMISNKNDIIVAAAEVYPLSNDMKDVILVAELTANGKSIWSGETFANYIDEGEKRKWFKVYHTIKLSDNNINYPGMQVKIYIWNKGKKNFFVDDLHAGAIKGNPYLYGIEQPMK